jgi:LEA14-like dessication related protein
MLNQAMADIEGTFTGPGTTVAGVDTRPRIEIQGGSASWGQITRDTTNLRVTVNVYNPNSYPIPVPGLDGDLRMNDVVVGEWTGDDAQLLDGPADRLIAPDTSRETTFTVAIDNEKIDDWFVTHVKNGEQTQASTTMRLRFDIGDIQFYIPENGGMTCRFSFSTAILEDRNTNDGTFQGCGSGSLQVTGTVTSPPDSSQDSSDGAQDDSQGSTDDSNDSDDGGLLDGFN